MMMKRVLLISALLPSGLLIAWFALRNPILNHYAEKVKSRTENKTGFEVQLENPQFRGLKTITIDKIKVTNASDTLLKCDWLTAGISITGILTGSFPVNDIEIVNSEILVVEKDDSSGVLDLLSKQDKDSPAQHATENNQQNYFTQLDHLIQKVFKFSELNINILNGKVRWIAHDYEESLWFHEMKLQNKVIKLNASHELNGQQGSIACEGVVDMNRNQIHFSATINNPLQNQLPFLQKFTGVKLFGDSCSGKLGYQITAKNRSQIEFVARIIKPGINHWRISTDDVFSDSTGCQVTLTVGESSIKTTQRSSFFVNGIPIQFEFGIHRSDTSYYDFNLGFDSIPSDVFFTSLPESLFGTLKGIKTKGKLSYALRFALNPDNPDSLIFASKLTRHNFSIVKFGEENFSNISEPFIHYVRENDRIIKSFPVDERNPYFTPLHHISPLLINAVLTSEDAAFYYHKGFSERTFRQSIATNIKEKRFARGGSTITMQLVKNVFLDRNKTISRKVEEALIVWLIENNRLVTKERLLEVYLNIIEWGPGIHGIGEASEFYFSKKPWQLSLDESIYLSAIIPRPKYFKYLFEKDGTIRESMRGYFNVVTDRLKNKEIITEEEAGKLNFLIELKGRAREMILPADSLPADSVLIELPEGMFMDLD